MGLFSNRIDRSLLKPGDHVYCYRNNHIYSHHGIFVGDNKVIHLTRTQVDGQNDNPMISCQVCKHKPKRSGVVKCCLDCFLKGHKLFRFKYGISSTQFVMNRSGTCSTSNCCYSRDDVVRRATDMLHSSEGQAFSLRNKVEVTLDELTSQPFSAKKVPKIVFKTVVRIKRTCSDMIEQCINKTIVIMVIRKIIITGEDRILRPDSLLLQLSLHNCCDLPIIYNKALITSSRCTNM